MSLKIQVSCLPHTPMHQETCPTSLHTVACVFMCLHVRVNAVSSHMSTPYWPMMLMCISCPRATHHTCRASGYTPLFPASNVCLIHLCLLVPTVPISNFFNGFYIFYLFDFHENTHQPEHLKCLISGWQSFVTKTIQSH